MRKLAISVCRLLEIISVLGILGSLFVMIWLEVLFGVKIFASSFILFVIFTNLADKAERLKDDKN